MLPPLRRKSGAALLALSCALACLSPCAPATAQSVVFSEVHTIAAPTTAVPQEFPFTVATPGNYTVTLTDLGALLTPTAAPLASVEMAVTGGTALVGTPLVTAGTLTLTSLTAGTYVVHVAGMPGNVPGSGPIGIVVDDASMNQIATFSGTLALPSGALPNGEAVLDDSFMVQSSGSYTATLTDLQLPQSLTTLELLLIPEGGAMPLATLSAGGSTTVSLSAGVTYDIFAVGAANATANAGLFSAVIAPSGGGAVVFGRTVPVGNTLLVGTPSLSAGSDTLTLADLKYPAALSQLGAVLTLNGQAVATLAASGSQGFAASAGTYSLFAVGTAPTAAPAAGSYAVAIQPTSGAALFSAARAVVAAGSALTPYSFDTSLTAAGSYNALLADFQFPAALASVSLAVVQNGALLGTPLSSPGQLSVSGTAGPMSLLAFAQSAGGGGLFGVDVNPAAGGSPVLEVTQGVGAVFTSQEFVITSAGSYSVTATDLGFPAAFANFDTLVTQGTQSVGSVYGGGTFNFVATAGTYSINLLAQTAGSAQAGTYALTVAPAPPAPTVTLTVDNSTVSAGGMVDLIWSSQNATACTASGGWSGPEPLSGTATSAALSANTTFTLTCTGAGGSTAKSVQVTVTAASSGGGGGSVDPALLVLLLGANALRGRQTLGQRRTP